MNKRTVGFTIVELLIVIVVIGILAAVSIVAYNGIQQKARNAQTTAAVASWIKALKLYHADHGQYPHVYDSCLGERADYPWDFEGATSGNNQCRQTATSYYVTREPFVNLMRPYFNNGPMPTPDMTTIGNATSWFRGATYTHSGLGAEGRPLSISYALQGNGSCVSIGGLEVIGGAAHAGGRWCVLRLGFNAS